jgi:hypothetical protein
VSTKSATGHTLAAAGALEAVFSVLSIRHALVPANLRFATPIEGLRGAPVIAPMQRPIRTVLSTSFGFGGNDTAIWNHQSRPTLQACVRWVSASNDDMLYTCANSVNRSDYNYNNVQMYVSTWGHRFSDRVHILTEAYYMYGRQIPGYGPGFDNQVAGSSPLPGKAAEYGIVNYLNVAIDPKNMISFRNEFYNDQKGQRTGFPTRYTSHTLGMTHWVTQDLEIRPELRYEKSYDVDAYDGGRKDNQVTALVDAIWHY